MTKCSEEVEELDLCIQTWMTRWAKEAPAVAALLDRPEAERLSAGYGHTLREIGQQPPTWLDTAVRASAMLDELAELSEGREQVVLTGSGSSQFAREPACRHLVITCNERGLLARSYRQLNRVRCLLLDPRTCDQSLVMTSSFTNMVIAGQCLGRAADGAGYRQTVSSLSQLARAQMAQYTEALADVSTRPFRSVLYLGDGCRYGAAMESALKMLEITNGRISTRAETFLGVRHGPMCAIHPDTLVVGFLSSDPVARAYQLDLLAELRDKRLGLCRVVVGEMVRPACRAPGI